MTKLLIGILIGVCRYQRPAWLVTVLMHRCQRRRPFGLCHVSTLRQHPDGFPPAGSLFVFGDQSGHRVALRANRLFHQVAAFLAIEVWRRLTALDHHRS
jgi:hypothetical protein